MGNLPNPTKVGSDRCAKVRGKLAVEKGDWLRAEPSLNWEIACREVPAAAGLPFSTRCCARITFHAAGSLE
jgi:hypothetical protein